MKDDLRWIQMAVSSIWLSVLLTSVFAPDFISGSQQEHIKIAALLNWLWGAMATMAVLRPLRRGNSAAVGWPVSGAVVAAIWVAVAVVSLAAPVMETGTDPTRIPLAAIFAPIVGLVFTRYVVEFLVDG